MLRFGHIALACALAFNGLAVPGAGTRQPVLRGGPAAQGQQAKKDEKKRARVAWEDVEIGFEGNVIFASDELLRTAWQRIERHKDPEAGFDEELLEYSLTADVLNLMRSKGYLEAKVRAPKLQEMGRGLKVTVPVEEGLMYHLGQIKIEGAKRFSEEQLRALLDIRAGDVANVHTLLHWLNDRVKRAYGDSGHIQYFADIEPHFKSAPGVFNEGVVDLTITITEGVSFVLRKVEFKGAGRTPGTVLRNALAVREGETFSQRKFDETLKNINDLNLFDWIDEGEVEFRTDEEAAELFIVIRLKERQPDGT